MIFAVVMYFTFNFIGSIGLFYLGSRSGNSFMWETLAIINALNAGLALFVIIVSDEKKFDIVFEKAKEAHENDDAT